MSVRGCQSDRFKLSIGVPQGSCLGPLLFTTYASSLLSVVNEHLPSVHCYADDTQLYVSFSPADETGQMQATTAMELCIEAVRNWMLRNRLLVNEDKTDLLLIGRRHQLAKINVSSVRVGAENVESNSLVKTLGVWFDSNLSMHEHITRVSSATFYHLYIVSGEFINICHGNLQNL